MQQEEIPKWKGEGVETEMVLMNRDELQALAPKMPRNMPIDMGGIRGKLIAFMFATGSILVERDNQPDIEIMLYTEPTLH